MKDILEFILGLIGLIFLVVFFLCIVAIPFGLSAAFFYGLFLLVQIPVFWMGTIGLATTIGIFYVVSDAMKRK